MSASNSGLGIVYRPRRVGEPWLGERDQIVVRETVLGILAGAAASPTHRIRYVRVRATRWEECSRDHVRNPELCTEIVWHLYAWLVYRGAL